MFAPLQKLLSFFKREGGAVSIEAVLAFMPLMIIWISVATIYDISKQSQINLKANYIVADALSRETANVSSAYLENMHQIFIALTEGADPTGMRITVVHFDLAENAMVVDWSYASDGYSPHQSGKLIMPSQYSGTEGYEDYNYTTVDGAFEEAYYMSTLADQEALIMVETWEDYNDVLPFMRRFIGIIYKFSITSPRFAPTLGFDDGLSQTNG